MKLFLLLAFLAQDETVRQVSWKDRLDGARKLREAAQYVGAVREYRIIRAGCPTASIKRTAHFELAGTMLKAGDTYTAYHEYEAFILAYPQSEEATQAKRREMTAALRLAREGDPTTVLGISLWSTSQTGVDYLRDALRRYPREEFSGEFTQRLGMYFYENGEFDQAEAEFQLVLDQYGSSPDAVLALFMLGRSSEQRFDAIDYDDRPLKDSRRHYERFIEEADRMRRLPAPSRDWVNRFMKRVQDRLSIVYTHMQNKQYETADYYDWKGYPKAARIYYRSILKDEASFRRVIPKFRSDASVRARAWLGEAAPASKDRPQGEPPK